MTQQTNPQANQAANLMAEAAMTDLVYQKEEFRRETPDSGTYVGLLEETRDSFREKVGSEMPEGIDDQVYLEAAKAMYRAMMDVIETDESLAYILGSVRDSVLKALGAEDLEE